jgi:hypothetical protein
MTLYLIFNSENWNNLLYTTFSMNSNDYLSVIYLVICLFIGNYVLLNLFLAILLDGNL